MPASTYEPLGSLTLSSAQSQVTLSNIPQTYTDLVLVMSAQGTGSGSDRDISMIFNGDSGPNYSRTRLFGNGTSAQSSRTTGANNIVIGNMPGSSSALGDGNVIIQINNYSNSVTNKTVLVRANTASTYGTVFAIVGLWRSASSVSSVTFTPDTGNFASGSTFNLYGVGANQLKATGGDIIVSDGTYWYHAFTKSGTFKPLTSLTCDYLVVAGGGGSSQGAGASGGGGAGGLRSTVTATGGGGSLESALSLSANTAYTITIGAGGSGGSPTGANGSDSTFSTITSTGGGRSGGPNPNQNGASGGSGGGGGEQSGIYGTGGAGTANQGYAGGAAGSAVYRMGGGGGAGAVGVAGGSSSGNGGAGVLISALATVTGTGISGYYAGGGGGAAGASAGVGGAGGGGNGGTNVIGTPGIANTGGGGGGSYVAVGTPGGSGLVIVRYAV
jgi:hypothetical protein